MLWSGIFYLIITLQFDTNMLSLIPSFVWETPELQILDGGEQIDLNHFRPIKPLGSGDTGRFVWCFHILPIFLPQFCTHYVLSSGYHFGTTGFIHFLHIFNNVMI